VLCTAKASLLMLPVVVLAKSIVIGALCVHTEGSLSVNATPTRAVDEFSSSRQTTRQSSWLELVPRPRYPMYMET
jgi:hypothetical protein